MQEFLQNCIQTRSVYSTHICHRRPSVDFYRKSNIRAHSAMAEARRYDRKLCHVAKIQSISSQECGPRPRAKAKLFDRLSSGLLYLFACRAIKYPRNDAIFQSFKLTLAFQFVNQPFYCRAITERVPSVKIPTCYGYSYWA